MPARGVGMNVAGSFAGGFGSVRPAEDETETPSACLLRPACACAFRSSGTGRERNSLLTSRGCAYVSFAGRRSLPSKEVESWAPCFRKARERRTDREFFGQDQDRGGQKPVATRRRVPQISLRTGCQLKATATHVRRTGRRRWTTTGTKGTGPFECGAMLGRLIGLDVPNGARALGRVTGDDGIWSKSPGQLA
jgi:hypothetical protein